MNFEVFSKIRHFFLLILVDHHQTWFYSRIYYLPSLTSASNELKSQGIEKILDIPKMTDGYCSRKDGGDDDVDELASIIDYYLPLAPLIGYCSCDAILIIPFLKAYFRAKISCASPIVKAEHFSWELPISCSQ